MKFPFKGHMSILRGRWWALVGKTGDVETWASLGQVEDVAVNPPKRMDVATALSCYKLAFFYYEAGLLQTISAPLVRCDSTRVICTIDSDGVVHDVH